MIKLTKYAAKLWNFLPILKNIGRIVSLICLSGLFVGFHPFYVSVTEINYDKTERVVQVSCKIFTDDFENTLRKQTNVSVDLINPKDRSKMESLIKDYIEKNLIISKDGKQLKYSFLGYEKEEEAIWSYFITEPIIQPKRLSVINTLLYDFKKEQINIVQVTGLGNKQSSKTTWPEKKLEFEYK